MRGVVAFEQGAYQEAVTHMASVFQKYLPNRAPEYYYAVALLKAGRTGEAIVELKRLAWWSPISWPPVSLSSLPVTGYWPIGSVKAHYWLGVAYEQQGKPGDAVKEYEEFLNTWKDAEKEWPEMADAKARLAKLKSGGA
jgi:tetratricopeptide (TPR) repeat protein